MPAALSGLTALRTPWVPFSERTVASVAFWFFPLSSRPPVDSSTIGTVPFACLGSLSSSRSVARVEPVPGRVRSSEVWLPTDWAATTMPTTATAQIAITTRRCRAHRWPSR